MLDFASHVKRLMALGFHIQVRAAETLPQGQRALTQEGQVRAAKLSNSACSLARRSS
jgi:hypothetical protein